MADTGNETAKPTLHLSENGTSPWQPPLSQALLFPHIEVWPYACFVHWKMKGADGHHFCNKAFKKLYGTGGKHKARGPNLVLHLVLSSPAPCFYRVAAPSYHFTVKE